MIKDKEKKTNDKSSILVIDDTPANWHLLTDILSKQGYKVRTIPNSSLALKAAQANLPDLILLDIVMSEMDGYQVCQTLKADDKTKDIPVIFISALNEGFDKVQAFEVGGADYISKPFQLQEVMARVKHQLRLRTQAKQLLAKTTQLEQEIVERQRIQEKLSQSEASLKQAQRVHQQIESALRQSEAREREKAERLQQAFKELRIISTPLLPPDKMSSLERIFLEVAQKIKNYNNSIYGNLNYTRQYVLDLLELVQLYQQTYPKSIPEIQQLSDEIDLEFLVEDCSKLMDDMNVGTQGIAQIVRLLTNFFTLDKYLFESVDIHASIEQVLFLQNKRICATKNRPSIRFIKNYSKLPLVPCYATSLNQVFINIIDNAIEALDNQPEPRWIKITTEISAKRIEEQKIWGDEEYFCQLPIPNHQFPVTNPQFILIRIADNGCGMNEEVHQHIFEPFFTTKSVGRVAGLGLAISHHIIVDKHQGKIRCVSCPGKGTELIIEIPLNLGELS